MSCPSHDIMDQTQLHRPMLADNMNMVRTESSNILSPMLSKKHVPLSKQIGKPNKKDKEHLVH